MSVGAVGPSKSTGHHWRRFFALLALALMALLAWTLLGQIGSPALNTSIGDWTYRALNAGAAAAVLVRAVRIPEQRLAWALIGAGLTLWTIGDLYYGFVLIEQKPIPYPSLSDALYFTDFIFLIAGLRMLTTQRDGPIISLGLLVSILGLATIWSALVFDSVVNSASGSNAAIATTLAYPMLDLLLLACTLIALAARGWRFDRVFVALAVGFAVTALADSIYAVKVAHGDFENGPLVYLLWPTGILLAAVAAWVPPDRTPHREPGKWPLAVLAASAIVVAISIQVWDHFFDRLGDVTVILSGLTLLAALVQLVLLHRDRQLALARALAAESLQSASSRAALDCVITIDGEGLIREWNDAASATFGHAREAVVGRELADLIIPPGERDHHRLGLKALAETGQGPMLNRRVEVTAVRAGGAEFPVELAITKVQAEPPMYTGFLRDITERNEREAENMWLASIVRSSEDAIISRDLAGAVTAWNHGAELLYGYTAEEAIGRPLNQLIVPADREGEIDEVFERLAEAPVAAYETERRRKNGRLVSVSMRAFAVHDFSGVMVGASAIAHDITDRKRREEEERRDRGATLWRERIEAALDEDRLLFFGQPVVDLRTGVVAHQELLIRMELDGKIIPPGAFLPHAEKTELIRRVDRWAVERGIELAPAGRVAINLSAKSLDDPELSERIEEALADRALAENVIFEITETAAASNLDRAQTLVTRLTELGCGVSLDDFGTGYGSFTYLKQLPVTELKIDIQFIRGLVDDPADRRVVESMISVAQNFGIKTVAEGVEDEATLELLRELGVDMVQGYHLGRPAPLSPPAGGKPHRPSARKRVRPPRSARSKPVVGP